MYSVNETVIVCQHLDMRRLFYEAAGSARKDSGDGGSSEANEFICKALVIVDFDSNCEAREK